MQDLDTEPLCNAYNALRNAILFNGVRSRADMMYLASLARRKCFARGDIVHSPGCVTDIAVIVRGSVVVKLEGNVEPLRLNVGSIIGEMEFFSPTPNNGWLIALEEVELLCVSFDHLRDIVAHNPCTGVQMYSGFLSILVDKLRDVNGSLVNIAQRGEARHLAHDLRAPIAALQSLGASMSSLSDRERSTFDMVIARMGHIAASERPSLSDDAPLSLDSSLDALLEEKRVQHSAWINLTFERERPIRFGKFQGIVDATALLRIVSNLLDNSVEALDPGTSGKAWLSFYESPGILRIDVTDTGRGIPPRFLEQLGSRPLTHGKADGQGIGLFHAFRVIEGMGGQMVICSAPGFGAVISLRLYAVL